MKSNETKAWELYCKETAGSMDVKDFWNELSPSIQQRYLDKVKLSDPTYIEFPAKNSMSNFIHLLIYINKNLNEKELEAFYDNRPTKIDDFLKENCPAYLIRILRDTMYGFKFSFPQYSRF